MTLNTSALRQMVHEIMTTHMGEISCPACFEQIDRFAEIALSGRNAAQAMPLVQDHLDHCQECRQEFQVLLFILRHMAEE